MLMIQVYNVKHVINLIVIIKFITQFTLSFLFNNYLKKLLESQTSQSKLEPGISKMEEKFFFF